MEIPQDEKEILHELPVNGIVKKDGIRYITELDETKTRILDRYRIGKQMGKVVDKS
jgi:cDNA FLJ16039 fis, clone ADRGL2001554, weakly similar to SERINE/THREONINE-PROTEIN KINASE PLK